MFSFTRRRTATQLSMSVVSKARVKSLIVLVSAAIAAVNAAIVPACGTMVAAAGVAMGSVLMAGTANAAEPVRVTTSFDVKYAPAVLREVAQLFNAAPVTAREFDRGAAKRVAMDIDVMKADQPRVWQFTVQYLGQERALEIRAQLDDLGMIDLDFATDAVLAPLVRAKVDNYLNGRGR